MRPEAKPILRKGDCLLAFDTSAAHCAAAVLLGERVVVRVEVMAKGQAERLVALLDEVLAEGGVGWGDLSAIAVGTGPGNFTGIRIAVSLARGLALGLGVPAVGVTGFEALGADLVVAIPAPRGQFYVKAPGTVAELVAVAPEGAARFGAVAVAEFVEAIARVGRVKAATAQPRPAPFYLRAADAAPASDPPPVILP